MILNLVSSRELASPRRYLYFLKDSTMFNVIVVIISLAIGLLIYKLYLEHKMAMKRKEMLSDAKNIFIG